MAIKKSNIIDFIISKLKEITTANGYYSDAGNNVFESRMVPFDDTEVPGINIREAEDAITDIETQGANGIHIHTMQIEIDIVSNGKVAESTLREIEIDVNKVIKQNQTWNGYAEYTNPVTVIPIFAEHDENKLMKKTMIINIVYKTIEWSEE